jgi:hypothetical protein
MLFASIAVFGQASIKGLNVVEINYGLSKHSLGRYGHVGYGKYFGEKFMLRTGISYENGFIGDRTSLRFNNVYLNIGNSYNIFTFQNKHGLNVYYNALFGLEYVESLRNNMKDRTLLYGLNLGVEYGYIFNDVWGIKAKFEENWWPPSKLGSWNYVFTLGVNFYL